MIEKQLNLLEHVLGSYYASGKEYLFFCPFCNHHKRKLSCNLEKGFFKCWVCEKSGAVFYLIKRSKNKSLISEWQEITGAVDLSEYDDVKKIILDPREEEKQEVLLELPEEYISLVGNKELCTSMARKYLHDRKVEEKDICDFRIGFAMSGSYENRVIIPSFNNDGKINYFVSRTYTNDYFKYKNPPINNNVIFNWLFIDWRKPVTLVEGVFDSIVAGFNSIPLLGSILKETSKLFVEIVKHNTPCYLALDPDAKQKEMKIMQSLLLYDMEIYKIPVAPYKDVGEMTKEEFQERKKKAIFIDNDKMVIYKMLSSL